MGQDTVWSGGRAASFRLNPLGRFRRTRTLERAIAPVARITYGFPHQSRLAMVGDHHSGGGAGGVCGLDLPARFAAPPNAAFASAGRYLRRLVRVRPTDA